jgi:hypothetical protein
VYYIIPCPEGRALLDPAREGHGCEKKEGGNFIAALKKEGGNFIAA